MHATMLDSDAALASHYLVICLLIAEKDLLVGRMPWQGLKDEAEMSMSLLQRNLIISESFPQPPQTCFQPGSG